MRKRTEWSDRLAIISQHPLKSTSPGARADSVASARFTFTLHYVNDCNGWAAAAAFSRVRRFNTRQTSRATSVPIDQISLYSRPGNFHTTYFLFFLVVRFSDKRVGVFCQTDRPSFLIGFNHWCLTKSETLDLIIKTRCKLISSLDAMDSILITSQYRKKSQVYLSALSS